MSRNQLQQRFGAQVAKFSSVATHSIDSFPGVGETQKRAKTLLLKKLAESWSFDVVQRAMQKNREIAIVFSPYNRGECLCDAIVPFMLH